MTGMTFTNSTSNPLRFFIGRLVGPDLGRCNLTNSRSTEHNQK